jgi:hypothetical protein
MSILFGTQTAQPYGKPSTGGFPFKAVASGLRLVALVAFVMPFATVSCGGQDLMTVNGLQAAFGTTYSFAGQTGHADGDGWFVMALLLIAGALFVGLLRATQTGGLLSDHQLNVAGVMIGLAATIIFLLAASSAGSQSQAGGQSASASGLTLRWDFGFWLALLGILGSTALAAVSAFPQQFGMQMARLGATQQLMPMTASTAGAAPPGPLAVGTLSPEGTKFWNGTIWAPIDDEPGQGPIAIGMLSPDGSRFWNGSAWIAVE